MAPAGDDDGLRGTFVTTLSGVSVLMINIVDMRFFYPDAKKDETCSPFWRGRS